MNRVIKWIMRHPVSTIYKDLKDLKDAGAQKESTSGSGKTKKDAAKRESSPSIEPAVYAYKHIME